MNRMTSRTIVATLAVAAGLSLAQADEPAPILTNHGIASGQPEAILPANAVLHARIKNVQGILENIEQLALDTVPVEAVPPAIRPLLNGDHPLLTLAGMPLIQAPLSSETIAQRIGVDSEAPISVTLYPGDPRRSFIVSIGLASPEALSGFLSQVLRPEMTEATSIGGRSMTRIHLDNLPVRNLYLSTAADRVYVTAEPSLLLHLHDEESLDRLNEDDHMADVLAITKHKDIMLTVNPGLIKPLLSQLPMFKYLPLTFLAEARSEILNNMPGGQRQAIEEQLRRQTNIEDLDQVADYIECLVTATYEQLFDGIYASVDGLHGTTLAIRFDHAYPEFSTYLHHDYFSPGSDTRPIPLPAIKEALTSLGTETRHITISGQAPEAEPSQWVSTWIDRARTLIEKKGLNADLINAIQSYHETAPRTLSVASQSAWKLDLNARVNPRPALGEFDTIQDFVTAQQNAGFARQSRPVTVLPHQSGDFLRDHIQSQIDARRQNQKMATTLFAQNQKPQWLLSEERLFEASLPYRVTQLTQESAYISQVGLFGYNQHEFINRKIYYAKPVGNYLVYHQAAGDAHWLSELESAPSESDPSNLTHLLDRIPRDVNFVTAHRALGYLTDVIDTLQDAEDLLHRDLAHYLDQVESLAEGISDRDTLIDELQSLPYSPAVASINQDESGKFYCLLPGNLTFPRDRITPNVGNLFASFQQESANKGGLIAYTRTLEGTKEWSFIWNTEGVSTLVRSVGKAVVENFLANPAEIQRIQHQLVNERDRDPKRLEQILARNPAWDFLQQVRFPMPGPAMTRKIPAAQPEAIEERAEEASPSQIDLSGHYNGALTETWHQGGITENDLANLPRGLVNLAGVDYDIRGVVQLSGQEANRTLSVQFPSEVPGIAVNHKADRLHFLQATGWPEAEGRQIATYVIHYSDGQTEDVPVEYGIHVRDWWTPTPQADVPSSEIAWSGSNGATARLDRTVQLYHMDWQNPRPNIEIAAIDFRSADSDSAPFLIAITSEAN